MSETQRILILGGGFGGVYTALELEKRLPRDADVSITLVNRDNFFLFTPMLHEVAASDLDLTHIANPIRQLLKRTHFFHGTVRFGDDPLTSALDTDCKAHDLDNLYVVDGSCFPASGAMNPALTIMANALRVGDHLLARLA